MVTEKSINMGLVYATIGLTGTIITYYGIKKYNAWKSAKNTTTPQTRSGSAVFGGGGGGTTASTSTTTENTNTPSEPTAPTTISGTRPAPANINPGRVTTFNPIAVKAPLFPSGSMNTNADGSTDKDMFDKFKQEVY